MTKFLTSVLLGLTFTVVNNLSATEILHEKGEPGLGTVILPMSESKWKSPAMICPEKYTDKDRVWSGNDFFIDEFGEACEFSKDWVKEHGYFGNGSYKLENGNMVIKTGKKGFYFVFGPGPNNFSKPGLRFGTFWGNQRKDRYRVRMEIEQNVSESKWEFNTYSYYKFHPKTTSFTVKGEEKQIVEADIGFVRNLMDSTASYGMCGFRFNCTTPNAKIKIKSIKIAPSTVPAYFRKKFTLSEKPVIAYATYEAPTTYTLYLNNKKVDQGSNIYPRGTTKTIDLMPYLKKGENILAFKKEFLTWSSSWPPQWLFEGIAIDKNGEITRILGDKSWKTSLKANADWIALNYDDSSWKAPKLDKNGIRQLTFNPTSDNKLGFTGINPRHMGLLQVSPLKKQYPVFSYKEKATFKVSIPVGIVSKYNLSLNVIHAESEKIAKSLKIENHVINRGLADYTVDIPINTPGPYRLEWSLTDKNGKSIEKRDDELIIVGPIKQKTLPLAGFDKIFEEQLDLVQQIDCSKEENDKTKFLDHSGMYSSARINRGKVVTENDMTYRETGNGCWDYFAYKLEHLKFSEPYLIEVVVPDNKDRYIYSGVVEQHPIGFCNNYPDARTGWFSSTGTAYTGVKYPLSFGKKKIRYIYYPSTNAACVVVMSGFRNNPAAACAVNIYKINGGLPGLQIPETKRMFGSHNERLSVMTNTTGKCEQQMMMDYRIRKSGNQNGWYYWYKAIERKIKLLRFQGKNMTVEGAFMYFEGDFPSLKHSSKNSNLEMDPPYLALEMYKYNGIKCILGVEYQSSQQLFVSGLDKTSERRMWLGEQGVHFVDRFGRLTAGRNKTGVNFLNPKIGDMILDLISEIYNRYEGTDHVTGLFMTTGGWWAPGFIRGAFRDIQNIEVGYGDYTVGLFEKECSIKLDVDPKDPTRFQKRYDKLMGELRAMWLHWRALKTKEFFEKIVKTIQRKNKWHFYIFPKFDIKMGSPFLTEDASRKERDNYMARRFEESGVPLNLYKNNKNITIIPAQSTWARYYTPEDNYMYAHGWNTNAGSRKIVKEQNAVYFQSKLSLDEKDCPADAAEKWWWTKTARGVFIARGVEDNCMGEFTNILTGCIPKTVFYSWLDCNMETGFDSQLRRFCKSFYATPELDFETLPEDDVKGIHADSAKEGDITYLRLVNNSPYPINGYIAFKADNARDLVYDRDLTSGLLSDKCELAIKPFDILVLSIKGLRGDIKCDFKLPAKVAEKLKEQVAFILKNTAALKKVPGDMVGELFKHLNRNDDYALYNLLQDFEVSSNVAYALKEQQAIISHGNLLKDLEKDRARIICASSADYIDPSGKRWLRDQSYTGADAYGHEGVSYGDRGDLAIEGTNCDRVYQTEAFGGRVFYRIPVPKGKYNLYLHFAETYVKNKRAGIRQFKVKAENYQHPKMLDPFALAGGWAKAYILEIKDLPVYDGVIDIELTGGVAINGIEIEKAAP